MDLIIADPPYGETNLDWDTWPTGWVSHAVTLLKPTGSLWCFGSFRMFLEHAEEFRQAGWKHAQELVWEKHNGSNTAADRFRRVHELIVHYYRGEWSAVFKAPVYTQDAEFRQIRRQLKPAHWNGVRESAYETQADGNRLLRSVIYARSCHRQGTNPMQKPVEIICPLIEHSCPPGGQVLDAFMGSGSVLEAAWRTGRRALGIDVRRGECQTAVQRLKALDSVMGNPPFTRRAASGGGRRVAGNGPTTRRAGR